MAFGCPYGKGTIEAKEFMRRLRARRKCEGGPGNPRRAGKRRKGGDLKSFFADVLRGFKDAKNTKGDLKDKFMAFANATSGKTDIRERRDEILHKLNKHQQMLLKRGIWKDEITNGLPKAYFDKMKGGAVVGSAVVGGAIPPFLLKLIAKLGLKAALSYWDKVKNKAQDAAWKGNGKLNPFINDPFRMSRPGANWGQMRKQMMERNSLKGGSEVDKFLDVMRANGVQVGDEPLRQRYHRGDGLNESEMMYRCRF